MSKIIKYSLIFVTVLLISLIFANHDVQYKLFTKIMKKAPVIETIVQDRVQMPSKFWLHRMNNLDSVKKEMLLEKYNGVELDIIFSEKNNQFDVNHDAKGYIENLLDEHFKYLQNNKTKIWLDFKNLNKDNAIKSRDALNILLEKYHIDKNQVIVESSNVEALKIYKADRYYVSYYVPYLQLEKMSEKRVQEEKNRIIEIAVTGNVSALSFPAYLYEFIKSMDLEIDLLTWDRGGDTSRNMWYETYFSEEAQNIINDEQIKVILVGDRRNKVK